MTTLSPTESLAAAVDDMLEAVVCVALGPTPKRNVPSPKAQVPNEPMSRSQGLRTALYQALQADDCDTEAPAAKRTKWTLAAQPAAPTATAAFCERQLAAGGHAPVATVDLEAAVGELLGGDSWVQLPSTHPSSTHLLGATQSPSTHPSSTHLPGATQPLPGPTAQAPTGQSEPDAAAPTTTTTAAALTATAAATNATTTAAPTTTIAAALSSNAAPTTTVAEEDDLELDVEPTQPVSGGAGDGVAPASGLAPTGYVAPTCQPLPGSEPTVQLAAHCPAAGSAPACLAAGAAASVRHGSGHAAPKLVLPACLPTTTSPATSDGFEEESDSAEELSPESMAEAAESGMNAPVPPPECIAQYHLRGKKAGSGGLGVVYPAQHAPSGHQVALKLGNAFDSADGPRDFTWTTFTTEWNTYCDLAGKHLPWAATAFECGLVRRGSGIAPWITLSLLGPSLHDLNQKGQAAPALYGFARGMLAALKGLHSEGFVHNDVKPANFCVPAGFDPAAAVTGSSATAVGSGLASQGSATAAVWSVERQQPALPVFLIDFGFAFRPNPATAGQPMDFVGTPDFASSDALRGLRPGWRDDLEALGYTLLELALKDLPWDITKHSTQHDSKGKPREISCWSGEELARMAARRDAVWRRLVRAGEVPSWLVHWVSYCRQLRVTDAPDYSTLLGFITAGEREAATLAHAVQAMQAAQGKAAVAPAAWACREE